MSDTQALHVTRNVIPGKLGVDLHLHRVHIPLVQIQMGCHMAISYSEALCPPPANERNSPTQIIQERSGRLIVKSLIEPMGLDRDGLEIIVSLQSCAFRLFVRGCYLRHTARTLHGEINVRVLLLLSTPIT